MAKLLLRAAAIEMSKEAYQWYEQQSPGLGDKFLASLELTLQKIESNPTFYGFIEAKFRQVRMKKFPYVVVYEIIEQTIVVFAVFHESRNPERKVL